MARRSKCAHDLACYVHTALAVHQKEHRAALGVKLNYGCIRGRPEGCEIVTKTMDEQRIPAPRKHFCPWRHIDKTLQQCFFCLASQLLLLLLIKPRADASRSFAFILPNSVPYLMSHLIARHPPSLRLKSMFVMNIWICLLVFVSCCSCHFFFGKLLQRSVFLRKILQPFSLLFERCQ